MLKRGKSFPGWGIACAGATRWERPALMFNNVSGGTCLPCTYLQLLRTRRGAGRQLLWAHLDFLLYLAGLGQAWTARRGALC